MLKKIYSLSQTWIWEVQKYCEIAHSEPDFNSMELIDDLTIVKFRDKPH